jgi:hypothetical protein
MEAGHTSTAFGLAAALGAMGLIWMVALTKRTRSERLQMS